MKKIIFVILAFSLLITGLVYAEGLILSSNSKAVLNDPIVYLSLGDFLAKNSFQEQALMAYNKALELDPENKAILNNLGIYYKEKNPLLAETYFKKALTVDPEYEKARNNLAILYNKMAMYDRASEQLMLLVNSFPDNVRYNYDLAINLAEKFYSQGKNYADLIQAIEYFKKVYDMNPGFEHTVQNIRVLDEIKRVVENQR